MLGHLLKWDDTTIRFIPLVHWLSRNTKIRTRSSRVISVQATSVLCRPLSSIERCLFLAWNYERFSVKHLTSFIKRIFENKSAKTGPLFWAKVLSSLTPTFYFPSKKMIKKISRQSSKKLDGNLIWVVAQMVERVWLLLGPGFESPILW